jgi:RNA polymerase sigma-70 factor (ECF subfamily)
VTNPAVFVSGRQPLVQADAMSGDDAELLRRARDGEHEALRLLYERHRRAVFGYLLSLTGSQTESEELLQDTFVAAWRTAGSFQSRSTVLTWLLGIARRRARDHARRRQPELTALEDAEMAAPTEGPDETVIARAELDEVARLIRSLRPLQREVLHLVFVEQLSYRETAAVLGVSPGTVASRLSAARAALAGLLSERGASSR